MADFKNRLKETLYGKLAAAFPLAPEDVELSPTPDQAMGDLALAFPLQLAKRLKRPPRAIAEEAAALLRGLDDVRKVEVAGAGFINLFLDRGAFFGRLLAELGHPGLAPEEEKIVMRESKFVFCTPLKSFLGFIGNVVELKL